MSQIQKCLLDVRLAKSDYKTGTKITAIKISVLLLVTVSVILLSLVLLIGYILYQEVVSIYPESSGEFSVPCDDLSLSPDEDIEVFDVKKSGLNIFVDGDGRYICSGTNLTNFVNLVLERQSRKRLAEGLEGRPYLSCGNANPMPKLGHLIVTFSKISEPLRFSGDSLSDVILLWDTDSRYSRKDPSVHYQNGEITIAEGRTYYLYASAHFDVRRKEEKGYKNFNKVFRFSVRICKRVHGYERTLLGTTKTFNISEVIAVSSLRIGGHMNLSKNDTIYMKVSNVDSLMPYSKGNSFGLFPT